MGKQPSHYAWTVLAMGVLVVFASLGLARFGYGLVLPAMQSDLGMDNTQAGMLASANLAGYLISAAVCGAVAAHAGPRLVIAFGLGLAGLAMLVTGWAEGYGSIAAWRALTGIGSGAANVPVMGLMTAWFGARRRGMATGIAVTGSSFALIVLGPFVPRMLAAFGPGGWRLCWFTFGGATLALGIASLLLLRNRPGEKGLSPLGTTQDEESRTAARPMSWRNVYRSWVVWHLGLVYVAFGFSYIIYLTFFFKRLTDEAGYSGTEAGTLFMTVGWASLLCGLIWGTISDRIGRKAALAIVSLIHAVAFGLFAGVPTLPGFTLSAVLFGLTAWSIPAIMAAACGDVLGPRYAPAALGFITLFFGIGQAAGPSIAGAIADTTGSFAPAYALASVVALSGALGAVLLPQLNRSVETRQSDVTIAV